MRRLRAFVAVGCGVVLSMSLGGCATPQPWESTLVSVNAAGTDAGNQTSDAFHEYGYYLGSAAAVFLPGGTQVAFTTLANNLGPTDTYTNLDIYLRDLETGTTTMVSRFAPADEADCGFGAPVVSPDGSKIAFTSFGDFCDSGGIYVRDLDAGVTTFVASGLGPVFSPDGNRIAFSSWASDFGPNDTNGEQDVYVRDMSSGTTTLVSSNAAGTNSGNRYSSQPLFSPDGGDVMFQSGASDLGPSDANGTDDIYLRDLGTGTTSAVSANASGTGTSNGQSWAGTFSPNGSKVVFVSVGSDLGPNDTNAFSDVYVRDLSTSASTLVSVNAAGTNSGNHNSVMASFSPDGNKVAWTSRASNFGPSDTNTFEDVYVRDLVAGTTVLVSANGTSTNSGNRDSGGSTFSPESNRILFSSRSSDLGPYDSDAPPGCDYPDCRDVYERDLVAGRTTLVSADADGTDSGSANSLGGQYSPDGSLVLFSSLADNLGPNDTNNRWDIYVAALVPED